ncbi:MAG TPA: hypothetical protein VGB03_08735, partial [Acidimicrobiales bacterium]
MARIRRLAALVGATALAGAFVTGPAQADSPEVFSGSAAGTALDLSILGKQAAFGVSNAKVNSAGVATASGAGQLTTTVKEADAVLGGTSAQQTADAAAGKTVTLERKCATPAIPSPLVSVINVGLVCSSASADNTNQPSASAEGSVAEADVHAETVVKTIEDTAPVDLPIGSTLAGVLDTVCSTASTACPATTTVNDLVESILHSQTLDVEVGKSTSSVKTGPSSVTSEATAAGAVVKILPLPQVNGVASSEPVVTITVGSSKVSTTYDRSTGKASATADPALVRIKFNSVLTDSIDLPATLDGTPLGTFPEIVVSPQTLLTLGETLEGVTQTGGTDVVDLVSVCDNGRAVCILPGSPLESRVYLASGATTVNPDGSATAVADAVRLDLLMGISDYIADNGGATVAGTLNNLGIKDPGVHLALAHAESAVGGKQAQVTPPNTNTNKIQELPRQGEPPLELPRTGGFPV